MKHKSVRIFGVNLGSVDIFLNGDDNSGRLLVGYSDRGDDGKAGSGEPLEERLEAADKILDFSSGDKLEFDN